MAIDAGFEKQCEKVADVIEHGSSAEAAGALSQALLPMNHADYKKFLESVANKTAVHGSRNSLDLSRNTVYLWSGSENQHNYVVVTPGKNLTAICKTDFAPNPKNSEINTCIREYARLNHLKDRHELMAGSTLVLPEFDD
jgi:hypothetical protein